MVGTLINMKDNVQALKVARKTAKQKDLSKYNLFLINDMLGDIYGFIDKHKKSLKYYKID